VTSEEHRDRTDESPRTPTAHGPALRSREAAGSDPPADTRPERARDRDLTALLRSVLNDLTSSAPAPLPPLSRPRFLRRLPHVVVCAIAVGMAFGAAHDLRVNYQLGFTLGAVCGFALGAAMILALWRPVPAWWLALGANTLAAAGARTHMAVDIPSPGPDWPWSTSAVVVQAFVLFLLALRVPTRVAGGALAVTALVTYVLAGLVGGQVYRSTGLQAIVVLALVVLFGAAFRGRREARSQLVEQASLTEEERARRTLLEERNRIARELHDVVAHHMSVVAIQAEAAPYRVENPPPELERAFVTIRENAVAALTELRRVLGVVRAEDYEAPDAPQPTLADMDALLANVRDAGLTVEKVVTGAVRELPQGVELSAYRIVQEALSNSLRHAPGASARVEIGYVLGGLGLRIVNGPMPEPSLVKPSPGAGHGITGMRERVSMLNGEMTVGAADHGGYEVTVFLPVASVIECADGDTGGTTNHSEDDA
jgi:signal transduction histidine kinase